MQIRQLPLALAATVWLVAAGASHAAVTDVQPRSARPGEATRLTLTGEGLDASLRAISSCPGATLQIESAEPKQAIVVLTLPADAQLGVLGLWTATAEGPANPLLLIVDDLPTVADNGNNHTVETAQEISTLTAVDGTSDGAKSDFYRFQVTAGQRVAFEILTQTLESKMDPLLRLSDSTGKVLQTIDDDAMGPDCVFSHTFATAGEYRLEVGESRYVAGGRYHLRVGDFPVLSHAFPLAARRGEATELQFDSLDGVAAESRSIQIPAELSASDMNVATRIAGGQSSAWVPLHLSRSPQFAEPAAAAAPPAEGAAPPADAAAAAAPLAFPIGISGRLSQPNETDTYRLRGVKDAVVRIQSRTRSRGCATLLKMQLINAADAVVAETKVAESDEWSFDYTFPDEGEYRLVVSDLLARGGPGFGYWIDIAPAGTFSIVLKADAAVNERFPIAATKGACVVSLQVQRFGYDGEIELALEGAPAGLKILNPRIAAKVDQAQVYVIAEEGWQEASLASISLVAHASGDPSNLSRLDSLALHRLKQPHVPFPPAWNNGAVVLSGVAPTDAFFTLAPSAPVRFARPLKSHALTLALTRVNAEFKAAVTVLPESLPAGWQLAVTAEADNYAATFTRGDDSAEAAAQLSLLVFAEFNGRGRLETVDLPVEWFDPLQVKIECPSPLMAGSTVTATAIVERQGDDPQPVTLSWTKLPPGITAPETITIPADQQRVEFPLTIAAEAVVGVGESPLIEFLAASKYQGQDFSVAGHSEGLTLVAAPARLEVYPAEIAFSDVKDRQQLVVTGFDAAEQPRDWSHDVTLTSTNPAVAEVRGAVVYPKANGETEIVVQFGAHSHTIPVHVAGLESTRRTGFESEVLVALSKQGCNSGACHGSPSGKGMFRLSLRAFDIKLDELTLIREDFGRRVNRLDPEQSLLILKPLMRVSHGGGKQLHQDDAAYEILKRWIAEGAAADPPETARCVKLEIFPSEKRILQLKDGGQQLAVTAHFSDGTQRDVTHLVAYETSNTSVATVDTEGRVFAHGRGEAVILARFLEHIESAPVMFVEQVPDFQWAAPQPANYIDELVNVKLQQLQYLPSPTCSDEEFLRRVYLDVVGILPTVETCKEFLADKRENKRSLVIDELLEREEFAKFWALKWGDLLKMTSKLVGDEGVYKYHRWVEDSWRDNQPYDEFAHQLLTASGSTLSNPPANFYRTSTDMNECVETISQVFLGARLQCAKCHNHPFERWTQDNYYGLGAFFNRIERRKTQRTGEMFVWASSAGDVTQPRTGEIMKPWLPQQGSIDVDSDQDRRNRFAEWLIEPSNPFFARIEANRIWSQLFSRGIVDPVDDFRDSNPPSNGPLLDALAADFVEHGYDRKHLLRTILNSRTYQASFQTNDSNREDTLYFSHQQPRLLGAEQLLDALNHATGLTQTLGNFPAGTKATHLPAPDIVKVDFLKVFGQPERSTVCACERTDDSNLGMAIELFNGPTVHAKLRDPANRFRQAIAAGASAEQALEELYFAAVCRPPSEAERAAALAHCQQREDVAAGLEDVLWALLNTDEFLFQH